MAFLCGNESYWHVSRGLLHLPSYLGLNEQVSTRKLFRGQGKTPTTEESKMSGKRPSHHAGTHRVVGVMEAG